MKRIYIFNNAKEKLLFMTKCNLHFINTLYYISSLTDIKLDPFTCTIVRFLFISTNNNTHAYMRTCTHAYMLIFI